ncbi:NAD(P)H-binding protein [Streptomyces sp. NPDC086777]|uniref:NAD(P)-dependent oxidoreductase n=1 Tax=Streptomyces sp. NPDC086777 TaxID=3154866 RepID=UPI00344C3662
MRSDFLYERARNGRAGTGQDEEADTRIVILGANGGTGRQLAQQALKVGHEVVAVTRNPDGFPIAATRLTVARADVHDRAAIARVVEGSEVVLSTLGVQFSRKRVTIYSDGTASIADAMTTHGLKRLVIVSSAGTEPTRHADAGFLLNRVKKPMVTRTIGKTTYADMRRMEAFLRQSNLDWTVMRPGGLFDVEQSGDCELAENRSERVFTSRAGLAASMLAQATSWMWIGKLVAVNTTKGAPTVLQMIRREAFGSH